MVVCLFWLPSAGLLNLDINISHRQLNTDTKYDHITVSLENGLNNL